MNKSEENAHVCRFLVHDGEAVCGKCGIVSAELTSELYSELKTGDDRASTKTDHYVDNTELIVQKGSNHAFISHQNKGLCFQLGNPGARDFTGKRVNHPTLKQGYLTGLYMERNGFFYNKGDQPKFKIDYNRDKFNIEMSQKVYQLCTELHLEIHERVAAGKALRHHQSVIIIGVMAELLPLMAIMDAMASRSSKDRKKQAIEWRLNEAREALRLAIVGDSVEPEIEDDLEEMPERVALPAR